MGKPVQSVKPSRPPQTSVLSRASAQPARQLQNSVFSRAPGQPVHPVGRPQNLVVSRAPARSVVSRSVPSSKTLLEKDVNQIHNVFELRRLKEQLEIVVKVQNERVAALEEANKKLREEVEVEEARIYLLENETNIAEAELIKVEKEKEDWQQRIVGKKEGIATLEKEAKELELAVANKRKAKDARQGKGRKK